MNDNLELIKNIYKPLKITKLNKVTIMHTTEKDLVIKETSNKDMKELFSYLSNRGFYNYPKLIDGSRDDYNIYEYIEGVNTPTPQKGIDLVNTITNLHNKTTYFKEVTEDSYKEIYENISGNILYLENKYKELFNKIELDVYMSPSNYLLIRNSSKILAALNFCKDELDVWYDIVKDSRKQRVAYIHNNLSLDHFIRSDEDYLVSWEHSKIDSPVLDLITFYQNNYNDLNFEVILSKYLERYPLNPEELKLFFIIISLPKDLSLDTNEFNNCKIINKYLNYLFKTEELVRPYYAKDEITE